MVVVHSVSQFCLSILKSSAGVVETLHKILHLCHMTYTWSRVVSKRHGQTVTPVSHELMNCPSLLQGLCSVEQDTDQVAAKGQWACIAS